jgi:hypothetical protein
MIKSPDDDQPDWHTQRNGKEGEAEGDTHEP